MSSQRMGHETTGNGSDREKAWSLGVLGESVVVGSIERSLNIVEYCRLYNVVIGRKCGRRENVVVGSIERSHNIVEYCRL